MRANLPPYAELHCISNFTFLRGASHPEELVARAKALGYRAIAITDECSLSGIVRAYVAAGKEGIDLLVGSEFRLWEGWRFLLLATDRGSYGKLSHLITLARRQAKKGEYFIDRNLVQDNCPTGCLAIWLPCFNRGETETNGLRWLAGLFPEDTVDSGGVVARAATIRNNCAAYRKSAQVFPFPYAPAEMYIYMNTSAG